jgi:ABC-2 type transport system ATP-binding protein
MSDWAIETIGLHKYFGNTHAVRGLDLQVARGEVFGLLGPNGAGKTTSLEMLEGLVPPSDGEMRILGMSWRTDAHQIRCSIGVQFQSTQLEDRITVREVLQIFGTFYPQSWPADELLALLQLQSQADCYQSRLSGGQRQRLALGLALVNNPALIFLDEPTTGLDPQARRSLWDLVLELKKEGRTVLLTTHYMDEAEQLCDRIGIMDQGRILQLGTPRELIASLQQPSCAELDFESAAPDAAQFVALAGLAVQVNARHWSVGLPEPRTDLQRVLSCVAALQLPMQRLHVRRATLEDVFLHRTGRQLREPGSN